MKKYLLLFALVCLLGDRALAQTYISNQNDETITEVIDFTSLTEGNTDGWRWSSDNQLVYVQNQDFLSKIDRHFRIAVNNTDGWRIGRSDAHSDIGRPPYFQLATNNDRTLSILNLRIGDKVKIYAVNNPVVFSHNTDRTKDGNNLELGNGDIELTVVNNSNLDKVDLRMNGGSYQGIRKIEITTKKKTSNFDYDPGFEVYDMWSTRSGNNSFTSTDDTNTEENEANAGFQLNGSEAQYVTITNYKATLNNRIAVSGNNWNAQYGLMPSGNSGWSNFSICNLREGDRVVLYYTEEAPKFSSNGENGGYNGSAAFRDTWNDGVLKTDYILDDEKDQIIKAGDAVVAMHSRPESNIGGVDLYTSYPYTVMENGHLDFAIKNDGKSRIVKVKIYSDHQAMMVDDTDEENFTYKSYFNITGELQAKEHIMPGGLEIHVGNTDPKVPDQNAVVVASNEGPVSYVKAVDGYKIPGITKSGDNININFNLHNVTAGQNVATSNIPKTGTFYKFMPEQDGDVTVEFQARSMNYYRYDIPGDGVYYEDNGNPWYAEWDRPNEQTRELKCPYYLVTATINPQGQEIIESVTRIDSDEKGILNGVIKTSQFEAEEGKVYYLYGGWRDNVDSNGIVNEGVSETNWRNWNYDGHSDDISIACGVAELLSVKFSPKSGVFPLSKWVKNGTEAVDKTHPAIDPDDLSTPEYELATIKSYTTADITVKKMSGNITECRPYIVIDSDGKSKLRIDGIKFAEGKNPGGTILMKLGDPARRSTPVFALTIAYSTDPKYDEQQGSGIRGHVWDYSTYSLNGLTWDTTNGKPTPTNAVFTSNDTKYAVVTDYGTSQTNDLLKTELGHGDWLENYNLIYNGVNYDKIFLNKYDVEGDNADVYWDTEGMVLKTSANQSGMNNEYGQTVSHSESNDPDRYIGILEGGEFRIPWLMKNDRVIIWMGTGKGRFADEVKLNIRNAYDAMHKPISESDEYIVGGSYWNVVKNEEGQVVTNDPYYRGCYHFFATGNPNDASKPADMVFKMKEGSLCKIYKIQIYRGDRIITNEIKGATSDDKFLLWSRAKDPNDANDVAAIGPTYNWTLNYFGKDQKLANGKKADGTTGGVNNDIVAWTGTGISTKTLTTSTETDPTQPTYNSFTFVHDYNTIGTFRARGKDMEKNMNYVADYAEHNVTVAHQQTMKYPYTWDLMDMTGWSNNATRFINEDAYGSLAYKQRPEWFDNDPQWNASYEKSSTDLSLFGKAVGNDQGYVLRLNSQETPSAYPQDNIFESAQTIDNEPYYGNQFWRDGEIVPESQGLWFHTLDQSSQYGSLRVYDDGMSVAGSHSWRYNMVVPNVPKDAAVYMRIKKARKLDCEASYKFAGSDASELTLLPTENDDEYIVAIKNDKGAKKHLTLSLAGYQMKKLSVSTDPKKLNIRGWATESRDHVIDPELTAYLTGKDIETCVVKKVDYANKTITLTRVYSRPNNTAGESTTAGEETTTPAYVMRKLADGGKGASILHNKAVTSLTATDGEIKILDGGFHLFVPDMHDYDKANDANGAKTITDNTSMLVAQVSPTTNDNKIPASSGGYTNYSLTYKYYKLDAGGNKIGSKAAEGTEAFYRIANGGASSGGNQGYLPLLTSEMDPHYSPDAGAKFSIIFGEEFEVNSGIATQIENVESTGRETTAEGFYNLNGQKLNGIPTQKGMYIVNGKKVLVK